MNSNQIYGFAQTRPDELELADWLKSHFGASVTRDDKAPGTVTVRIGDRRFRISRWGRRQRFHPEEVAKILRQLGVLGD